MSDGPPWRAAINGRSPAHVLRTSDGPEFGPRERLVGRMKNVIHVGRLRPHVVRPSVIVGVGGAQDQPLAPGNSKEDAFSLGHDHRIGHRQPPAIDHQVNAFGQPQADPAVIEQGRPRTGRVHHGSSGHLIGAIRRHGAQLAPPYPSVGKSILEPRVVADHRPVPCGRAERVDHQPGVVGQSVEVSNAAGQSGRSDARQMPPHLKGGHRAGRAEALSAAEQVVKLHADPQLPQRPARPAIGWKDKGQRLGQVGRDATQNALLAARFVHQSDAALGEIAQAAVQQPARPAAGAEGQIVLFDQSHSQPAHRRVACHARPHDSAAHDEHVERLACHVFGRRGAATFDRSGKGERGRRGIGHRLARIRFCRKPPLIFPNRWL